MRTLASLLLLTACGRFGFQGDGDAGADARDAATDDATDASAIDAAPIANRVFVTSSRVVGSFGGQAAADLACRDRALEGGLSGTFVSFVAAPTGDPFDRLAGSRGWVRVDGKPVYDTVAELRTRGAYYPDILDERGRSVDTCVWTGTNEDGTRGSATCTSWGISMIGQSGMFGVSTATAWVAIRWGFGDCSTACAFHCFEIGHDVAVAPPAPAATGRILFATHGMWTGGTLASADALCANDATMAGIPGTFRALLATVGQPPLARLASNTGPWRRGDRVPLTPGALGFAALEISADIGADGLPVAISPSFSGAWTGAATLTTSGTVGTTCDNWGSSAGTGIVGGLAETTLRAFGDPQQQQQCGTPAFLYCAQE